MLFCDDIMWEANWMDVIHSFIQFYLFLSIGTRTLNGILGVHLHSQSAFIQNKIDDRILCIIHHSIHRKSEFSV